jgi:hypothetical protein
MHTKSPTMFAAAAVIAMVLLGASGCSDSESPKQTHPSTGSGHSPTPREAAGELLATSEDISSAVDAIFRSINDGKFETLYQTATAPRFREAASLVAFESLCERLRSRLGPLRSKQSSTFDLSPRADSVIASASFQAKFDQGDGTIFVVFEKSSDQWLLLRLNVNAPALLDDPTQFRETVELFAEASDPVQPGTSVDLFDSGATPPKPIAQNVSVLKVRWKVADPSSRPQFPARGFVTVSLTKDQALAVEGIETVSVRRHVDDADKPDNRP